MNRRKQKKKGMEKAMISALLSKKKSLTLQRLLHDYEEIKNQIIPIPGVVAAPIDENMFEWHGNILSKTNNIFRDTVVHFKLTFPQDYPLSPPKIEVLSPYPSSPMMNYISGICIDFLEKQTINVGELPKIANQGGWNPGYTVLSILSQLQVFFFDVDASFKLDSEKKKFELKKKEINSYKCPTCLHKGSESPYPTFPENPSNKLSQEQFLEVKKKELCGYMRKISYQNSPLGIGINIAKVPRTGEIKSITPCFDFISLKTFSKQRIRTGIDGKRFTHWFPLYFGEKKEIFLKSVTKALSMIVNGNTREFSPDLIMKVMPKFINSICLNIINENVHNNTRCIEILLYVYRILIMFIQEFPEVKKEVNESLEKFIKDPEQRIKEKTPSLGDLLVMLTVSDHKIEELLPCYIEEQMDRQIFWIIQEIPQLEQLLESAELDDIRARVCFKCGLTGQQLLLLYYSFLNKLVFAQCKTFEEFGEKMDKFYGNLPDNEFYPFLKEINKILKIDSYNDSYKHLGMKPPEKNELNEKLKQSLKNSLKKNYHGDDKVRFVPPPEEQIKYYINRYKPIQDFVQDGKLLPADDPKWKDELINIDIVSQFKYTFPNKEMTPLNLVRFYRSKIGDRLFDSKFEHSFMDISNNRINNQINKKIFVYKNEDEDIIEKLTWRQLYIKFYFEEYCKFFPYIADFKKLYRTLELIRDEVVHFSLNISTSGILKSDFNYIRGIFTYLTSLKYLELIFCKEINTSLIKNLIKGLNNGIKEKCEIEHLKIQVINPKSSYQYSSKDLNLLTILDNFSSLKVLDLKDVPLDLNKVLRIRNHLYFYKKIKILDLSGCELDDKLGSELADGLMKNKSIEKVYISNNKMKKSLSAIIYNLSFQPSIKIIDISRNNSSDKNELATSLQKMIKMSPSIEYIIANHLIGLNSKLSKDFFLAIGDNNNLTYLDLSYNGNFQEISKLGRAISFNALKGGILSYLDISSCEISFDKFTQFIKSLSSSEEEHNEWYGFQFNGDIDKEKPEYFEKKFHCNLESLLLEGNNFYTDNNYLDPKNTGLENPIKTFLSNCSKLETLILGGYCYNKYFFDSLADALRSKNNLKYLSLVNSSIDEEKAKSLLAAFYAPIQEEKKEDEKKDEKKEDEKKEEKKEDEKKDEKKNEIIERKANPHFHIEELDLSCNKLGYSGFEALCNALKINTSIKKLNLFHNIGDVNCARRLSEVLKMNTTLVEIDIGYNRIKNLGIKTIIEAIKENKNSSLKYLGAKYNFIRKETFSLIMKIIEENNEIKIEEIDIKNNILPSSFVTKYYNNEFIKMNKKIMIDIFDIMYFLQPERLERTVWIPIKENSTKIKIVEAIATAEKASVKEKKNHIGIPLFIRNVRGRKTGKKRDGRGLTAFVEFPMPNSTNRMLQLGTTQGFNLSTRKGRVYKAGSRNDYLVVKKFEFK